MLIDGRHIAQNILDNLKLRVQEIERKRLRMPHLAVIRIGDDPAITSYIRQKEKMAKEIGALISVYKNPLYTTEKDILDSIHFLQNIGDIDGIILQLPLPKHLHEQKLLDAIHPEMDVDGFHLNSPFVVPLAAAVVQILKYIYELEQTKFSSSNEPHPQLLLKGEGRNHAGIKKEEAFISWLKSKNIAVIGKGKTGGQPTIDVLRKLDIPIQVIDRHTKSPWGITQKADIIISAAGKRGLITESMLKKDVILIGIGMQKAADGKFYGDYDIDDIKDIASYYTPIPGGVGPVNVAKLMENLVIAAENSLKN